MLAAVVILSATARADEADAVKLVEKLGGKVTRDDKQPGKPVVEVNLSLKKVTDADLKQLKELKQLASPNLFGCRDVVSAVASPFWDRGDGCGAQGIEAAPETDVAVPHEHAGNG